MHKYEKETYKAKELLRRTSLLQRSLKNLIDWTTCEDKKIKEDVRSEYIEGCILRLNAEIEDLSKTRI